MNCFSCFQSQKSKKSFSKREHGSPSSPRDVHDAKSPENKKHRPGEEGEENKTNSENIAAQAFNFREICNATKNFKQECLLGEGGFGRVFKGTLASTGQVVAVKQLDRSGLQGNKEFLVEVLMLSLLHHPNLVELVGYCADGDQRVLVYEFINGGSLEEHLLELGSEAKPLNWFARMKIAFGAAQGLEYLHDKANPPVIYGDMKPSNILLDEEHNPKLSDFGLVKLGPSGDKMNVPSRLMGTYGYSAPEYSRGGELTLKSDVYSFGVILLELITGRKAIDTTKPNDEQNLVAWAQPIFRDPKRFPDMADPLLKKRFPEKDLNQAVAIAAMCLQEEGAARPLMSDVVTALSFLSTAPDGNEVYPPSPKTPPSEDQKQEAEEEESSSGEEDDKSSRSSSSSSSNEDSVSSSQMNSKRIRSSKGGGSETTYESVNGSSSHKARRKEGDEESSSDEDEEQEKYHEEE